MFSSNTLTIELQLWSATLTTGTLAVVLAHFHHYFTACFSHAGWIVRWKVIIWYLVLVRLSHSLQSEWQHVSNDFHLFLADEGLLFWGCPNRPQAGGSGYTTVCASDCLGLFTQTGGLLTFYGRGLVLGSIQHILERLMRKQDNKITVGKH